MAIDPMWIWVAVGAVVLLVIVGLFARGARRAKSESLRSKFGPEYNHTVKETGSRTKAERELAERARESQNWNIRPLQAADADRYRGDWKRVEQHFIDRPTTAVVEADELINEIMRAKGYPMGDFDTHAKALSVTHPRIVDHYRSGHQLVGKGGSGTTEDMRQAMLHYRTLFEELLSDRNDVETSVPHVSEVDERNRLDGRPRPFDVSVGRRDDERGH
jgi:hypothetical protein